MKHQKTVTSPGVGQTDSESHQEERTRMHVPERKHHFQVRIVIQIWWTWEAEERESRVLDQPRLYNKTLSQNKNEIRFFHIYLLYILSLSKKDT